LGGVGVSGVVSSVLSRFFFFFFDLRTSAPSTQRCQGQTHVQILDFTNARGLPYVWNERKYLAAYCRVEAVRYINDEHTRIIDEN